MPACIMELRDRELKAGFRLLLIIASGAGTEWAQIRHWVSGTKRVRVHRHMLLLVVP